jgi:hypothetical protein
VTANQIVAPDGTLTAASVVYPAVSAAGSYSELGQNIVTTGPSQFSAWLRGNIGGERLYLMSTADAVTWYRTSCTLTTTWQRFIMNLSAVAGGYFCEIGTDLRDAGQTGTVAQTVYVWGAQIEQGAFPTSYIPTTGAAVTRAQDVCFIPPANMTPWFASPGGSWMAEFIVLISTPSNARVIGEPTAGGGGVGPIFVDTTSNFHVAQYDQSIALASVNTTTAGVVVKAASTWALGQAKICLNAGSVGTSAGMTNGYGNLASFGTKFLQVATAAGIGDNMTGYIRRVRYWPRVLSNFEMQQVTK